MADRNLALNLLIKAKDLASSTVRRFTRDLDDSGDAADRLDKSLAQADEQVDAVEKSSSKAGDEVGHFADELSEADKAAGRYYDSTGRLRDANGRFVAGARRARTETDKLGKEFRDTSKDAKTLTGRVGDLGSKLKGFLLGGAIATGLGRLFNGALRSSAQFERQMNRVEAVTRASAEEMRLLTEAAEEAGSTTEFTATQAGEGLEILARAGFDARESVELLPSVLAVATAEGVGLAEAAGLISDTLSVMQMEIGKGAQATDVLARGSGLANTRMTELGNAISYTGSFAREADLDLEQLVAVLDVLAKNGLRGERAGTGLRAILAQLSDPASKASKAIAELGIPTDNFIQMIEGLRQRGPEATQAINAFGIEAGPALRALLAEGAAGIGEFEDKLRSANGAAKEMADTASDDLIGATRGFQSAWDSLRKTLSNPTLEPLAGLLDRVAAKFREMKEAGNLRAWGEITAFAINRVSGAMQMFYNTITMLIKGIGVFASTVLYKLTETEVAVAKILNRIGLVSDETVKSLEISLGAMGAVVDEFINETNQDLKDIGNGWDLLTGEVTLAKQKLDEAVAESGEQAKAAGNTAAQASEEVAEAGDNAANTLDLAAQKIIAAFNTARDEGSTTAESIKAAFEEVDLTSIEGITALGTAMTEIAGESEALDTQLREHLAKTLEKMTAEELEAFRQKAIEAFADAEDGAGKLDRVLNGALDASLRKLGVDVEELRTGITSVGSSALQSFQTVREELERTGVEGKEASAIIKAAFEKAFDQVSTTAGLDELKTQLREAAEDGVISWGEYRKELQKIKEKYQEIEDAAKTSVDGQKKALGDLKKEAGKAADEIKRAKDAANDENNTDGGNGDDEDDDSADDEESGKRSRRSTSSTVANRLRAQGRDDAAEILLEKIAQGDVPQGGFQGLAGYDRWWEMMQKSAIEEADKVQAKYDQLAQYQRDIAAGDVDAAKRLLAMRNTFADLEADLVGIVTQASNLVNSQQAPQQQPGQQVQAPRADEVVVKFDFNGRQFPGRFSSSNASELLDELAGIAEVTR
ncbi:phage tail tape measure protein [Marinobacterium litorale]|uniref:phage tail tape measure protein n=1 Tax=Marinobacterium litorale TaxID=404770 RepID=UPI00040A3BC8|nr:phage tail tape measure protein [Marinobacterium litorale]